MHKSTSDGDIYGAGAASAGLSLLVFDAGGKVFRRRIVMNVALVGSSGYIAGFIIKRFETDESIENILKIDRVR